jgi:cytochrome c oxidase subunit 4
MRHEPVAVHTSWTRYLATWIGLVALTLLTFAFSFLHTGAWEIPIAMLIAIAKTTLVLLFFMHLIEQRFINSFVVIFSMVLVAMLIAVTTIDVQTRRTFPRAPVPDLLPPPPAPPPLPGGTVGPPPEPPPPPLH